MSLDASEKIKASLDIVDVIGETVSLTRKGSSYRGAVLASSKSGISLIVDPDQQVYNDTAGTAGGGDIFNWIAYQEGLDITTDFPTIIKIAAEKAGIVLPDQDNGLETEKKEIYPFLRAVAGYYHNLLTAEHREYIHEKWGISDKMIDELMIGWAPANNEMHREMLDVYHLETIKKSGMVYINGHLSDVFKSRIMFPYWRSGKVVYFIGRDPGWNPDSKHGKYSKQPVHSEKRSYISKAIDNNVFYGEDSIKRTDYCIITEGVTDCIMAMQEGLPCISPVTVRIKESEKEHAYKLVKNKERVIVCNDNEDNEVGKDGALATAEYLEAKGVPVEIIELPKPDGTNKIDLAEYLQKYNKVDFENLPSNNVWEIQLQSQNIPENTIDKVRAVTRFIQNDLKNMDATVKDMFIRNDVCTYFGIARSDIGKIIKSIDSSVPIKEDGQKDSFFTERGKLRVKKLGEYVMSLNHFITFEDTKVVMMYRNGVYGTGGEDIISKSVQDELGDASTKKHISEIINYVQLETLIPRTRINHDTMRINVMNGIYNLDTNELEPHDPNYISIVQIPINYDSEATCPRIFKFINDVVEPDRIDVIYEFIGYCLIPDTKFEKAMMLIGNGANGKSVLLSLLGTFIGYENTAHENLQGLETDPYSVAQLYGKLVNIFPDLASTTIYDNKTFKMLTGDEGMLRARQIYQPPFTFKNTCRLIFSANRVPPVPEDNYAYFRRWIPVKFPKTFEGEDADKDIINKLTTKEELSGLFNMAVNGLNRLMKNNDYSLHLTTDEIKKLYQINSDPISVFAEECIVYSEEDVLKSVILNHYVDWCQTNQIKPVHENVFSKRMKKLGYDTSKESIGNRRPIWQNCAIIYRTPKETDGCVLTNDNSSESVRGQENSPDGFNRHQDTYPSERPRGNTPMYVHGEKKNVNEKNNYVYVNNGAKHPFARTDCTKTVSADGKKSVRGEIGPRTEEIEQSVDKWIKFILKVCTKPVDIDYVIGRCEQSGMVGDPLILIEKLKQIGEIIKIDDYQICRIQ